MSLVPDEWMGVQFGFPVFKVSENAIDDRPLKIPDDERVFCYAKVPVGHVQSIERLVQSGFSVVDINVMFERVPELLHVSQRLHRISVWEGGNDEEIRLLAERSFVFDRFHADPRIPAEMGNQIKREWISSYLTGARGVCLLVAYDGASPAGFLAELEAMENGERIRIIDLIATRSDRRGKGIGKELVRAFVEKNVDQRVRLRVGTQLANVPSIRLYETMGFRMTSSAVMLHGHFSNGRPQR